MTEKMDPFNFEEHARSAHQMQNLRTYSRKKGKLMKSSKKETQKMTFSKTRHPKQQKHVKAGVSDEFVQDNKTQVVKFIVETQKCALRLPAVSIESQGKVSNEIIEQQFQYDDNYDGFRWEDDGTISAVLSRRTIGVSNSNKDAAEFSFEDLFVKDV